MKPRRLSKFSAHFHAFVLVLLFGELAMQAQAPAQTGSNQVNASTYNCVQRGPYSKVWQRSLLFTNDSGEVQTNTQSYTELGTGICYFSNGQWLDSVEQIDPVPGGAQATQGRFQVQWSLNADNAGGAVTIVTPDSKQLSSSVFGLAYYDLATGSNAAIAGLTNCTGGIVQPNQVLYANAFSNLNADVLYTYTKAGLSQDIVLHNNLAPPDAYGLSDATSILQVYTEFFTPPQPEITAVTNGDVVDAQVIDFGDMKMNVGETLFLNALGESFTAGSVTKQWVHTNNATYLIESVPYQGISNQLQQLPQASNLTPSRGGIRRLAFQESPLIRRSGSSKDRTPMKVAKLETSKARLKMDYELLSSSTNLVLQGDTTFFVSSTVNVSGTTTIEGGTVVKYTNAASAQIETTNIVWLTAAYRPAVFTCMNDNSAGTVISNSTGSPATLGNVNYLNFVSTANTMVVTNARFSYAAVAFGADENNTLLFRDCQFLSCATNVTLHKTTHAIFENILAADCHMMVSGGDNTAYVCGVNMTVDDCPYFTDPSWSYTYGGLTNCILTDDDSTISTHFTLKDCAVAASGTGIYQTVGAAAYYLANGSSYRDAGSATIDPVLLTDLQTLTTYPPVVLPSGWCTNNTTLFPQAQRDTDTPDLGYHYDPIDFAVDMAISNATVTVLPGTAVAGYGYQYGFYLYTNGIFDCEGTATSPNYLVQYNTVQEQSNTNWATPGWDGFLVTEDHPDNSSASCNFADWSVLADASEIIGQDVACPVTLQNCQLYNGSITEGGLILSVTNCLFQRANLHVTDRSSGNSAQTFYNNLFWGGVLTVGHLNSGIYTFRDNFFDQSSNTLSSGSINYCSNNAYATTNYGLLPPTNSDVFLTASPAFETGALGNYYYPSNLSLIHAGSQSAPAAGLYHYTVLTNANSIEGTNIVSIGFHYVGVGSNGLPIDTNGDGTPDYLEDVNGNGLVDSGEIDWLLAGDMGLTVIITQPANNSTIP